MPGPNWHTVYMGLEVLLVECKTCGRRCAIKKQDSRHHIRQSNMKELSSTKFRCSKCNGTEIRAYLPNRSDDIEMFLAGDPVGTMRQAL